MVALAVVAADEAHREAAVGAGSSEGGVRGSEMREGGGTFASVLVYYSSCTMNLVCGTFLRLLVLARSFRSFQAPTRAFDSSPSSYTINSTPSLAVHFPPPTLVMNSTPLPACACFQSSTGGHLSAPPPVSTTLVMFSTPLSACVGLQSGFRGHRSASPPLPAAGLASQEQLLNAVLRALWGVPHQLCRLMSSDRCVKAQ